MMIGFCYNTKMNFDPIEFRDFIRDIFSEWRGKGRESLADFAAHVGTSQQIMSNWYNGKLKKRPEADKYDLLLKLYGIRAYKALGIPTPDYEEVDISVLPDDMQDRFRKAMNEIEVAIRERELLAGSEEVGKLARETFGKYGFTVTSKENSG